MASIVQRYLETMVAHDFDAMAACLAEDVVRVGPFGDTYTPRGPYVEMLAQLMPSLPGYSMRIDRVVELEKGRLVLVELTETVEMNGAPLATPEALVFELNPEGLIAHISIYIQTLGVTPPTL
ncbi:MAG TPA: nuclear transport factor 2 family protein [Acidimicrobiales bacterium]|jgi:ketosteroid isomerase-like protein